MPAPSFPVAMKGRRFTVRFDALHRLLDEFVKTGDPVWYKEQGNAVLEEYSDEGTASGDEDEGGDEEDEDEQQDGEGVGTGGEVDGDYV